MSMTYQERLAEQLRIEAAYDALQKEQEGIDHWFHMGTVAQDGATFQVYGNPSPTGDPRKFRVDQDGIDRVARFGSGQEVVDYCRPETFQLITVEDATLSEAVRLATQGRARLNTMSMDPGIRRQALQDSQADFSKAAELLGDVLGEERQ